MDPKTPVAVGENMSNEEKPQRFLVIEDEKDIADLIQLHLSSTTTHVESAQDGLEGLKKATAERWDLIILDLQLPSMDGLEICRQLRSNYNYVPILMLTSRSTELDRVLGLELGADDYLTKPFSILELNARIKALLRRVNMLSDPNHDAGDVLVRGDLILDKSRRTISLSNKPVDLTAKEFDLLWFFASHPGKAFTRLELLQEVWGYGHEGYEHTVNSHINRLRGKVENDPANPRFIHTIWGVGYRFEVKDA
ncbi:response regulator transcription factor [Sessilibacter corallicola]|uniref:Response regulator transcription factor n=1 Tax=Sessilibacter corallicola TaxID=2904075 RepID=A0ABQ0A4I0_9GAMM|nr:response regulator transcription factor [Sessilibacter corallicola]MCE2026916.1 response regulator transcription factor [Sessilibacter corallicola]